MKMERCRQMKQETERIEWIDRAKGLGILMVMFGHNYLDWKFVFWCYSFHMALFFFLSGCTFHYHDNFWKFLKKKRWGLLTPYIFFAVTIAMYNWVSAATHGNSFDLSDAVLSYLVQIRYTHLWFLPCLFLTEVGTWAVYRICRKGKGESLWLIIAIGQITIFFVYRAWIGVDLPWNADLAVLGMGFVSFGIWYSTKADAIISLKCFRGSVVATAALLHLAVSWLAFRAMGSVDWYDDRFGNPVTFLLGACTGIFATVLISKRLSLRGLACLGANSIVWYGLHRIAIDATFILYNKLHIVIVRGSLLSLALALVSVAVATVLLIPVNRILNRYVPFLIGRRRQEVR